MEREGLRRGRLVAAVATLALSFTLVQAESGGAAETSPPGNSKLEVLTRAARVARDFQVSIKVRCVSPNGTDCVGTLAVLEGRGWWFPGGAPFSGTVAEHRGLYTVPAGGRRGIDFKILNYVRRPRDEHAGHHWVKAKFQNLHGKVHEREITAPVLLRWHRLVPPPGHPAH